MKEGFIVGIGQYTIGRRAGAVKIPSSIGRSGKSLVVLQHWGRRTSQTLWEAKHTQLLERDPERLVLKTMESCSLILAIISEFIAKNLMVGLQLLCC